MIAMCVNKTIAVSQALPVLAAGAAPSAEGAAESTPSAFEPALMVVANIGLGLIILGIIFCLYRMLRGPHLADRVLAGDTMAMHVVGLVILLSIVKGSTTYFDAALVVAIIGFASTLAFAQYIGGTEHRQIHKYPFRQPSTNASTAREDKTQDSNDSSEGASG